MNTLSLDLRGSSAHPTPREPRAAGAGLSLALHGAIVAAVVLAPLLGATDLPETAAAVQGVLIKPIIVALPSAPIRISQAPSGSNRQASVRPAVVDTVPPSDIPTSIGPGDVLDPEATGASDGPPGNPGGTSSSSDCPFGTLCGVGPLPLPAAAPTETPRVGGRIKEPRLLESRQPQYPPMAQAAGISGRVFLEAHVGPDGRVRDVRVLKGHPLFDEAALASVRTRRYEPLLLNGVPTDFLVTINVGFIIGR